MSRPSSSAGLLFLVLAACHPGPVAVDEDTVPDLPADDVPPPTIRSRLMAARALLAELADSPEVLASTLQGLDTWAAELQGQLRLDPG